MSFWSRRKVCELLRRFAFAALLLSSFGAQAKPVKLPAYNVDIAQSSVSGLSSGAAMATQFDVAHSSIMKGAGIVAGPPYYCAQFNTFTAISVCSCLSRSCQPVSIDVPSLTRYTTDRAKAGVIDDPSHLGAQKIFILSGTLDRTVMPDVMKAVRSYYLHFANDPANVSWNTVTGDHAMPTESYGKPCTYYGSPYIDDCNYDAAGKLIAWIYGPDINAKATGKLTGSLMQFDQGEFTAGAPILSSMDNTGWVYVPLACQQGEPCVAHVAFHGCEQGYSYVKKAFITHAGYNEWADTNHIIVLYPQAVPTAANPLGCWNWWGYDFDPGYATRGATQIKAVRAMLDRLASGHR